MQSDHSDRYQQASEVKTDVSSIPLAESRRSRQTAEDAAPTASQPRALASTPTKSPPATLRVAMRAGRAPLLIGIIVAALVISIGAFIAMRGPEGSVGLAPAPASPAPSASKSAQPQTTPVANASGDGLKPRTTLAAAPPEPIAATALPESGWKPLFTETEWKAKPGFKNGQLNLSHARATKPQTWSDGAIRARIEYREATKNPGLVARLTQTVGGFYYRFGIGTLGDHVYLGHYQMVQQGEDQNILSRHFLPAALKPGDKALLELRVQGDRLTGMLDGKVVVEAQDSRLQVAGEWGIIATEGWFEAVEVQPLPAAAISPSPNLPVSKSSDPKFPPGQWVKLFTKPEDLPADLRKPDSGVKWEDGWIRNTKVAPSRLLLPPSLVGNIGVRYHQQASWKEGKQAASVYFKNGPASDGLTSYMMQIDARGELQAFKGVGEKQQFQPISVRPMPASLLELNEIDLEYAIIGDRIVTRAGGTELMVAQEAISKKAPSHVGLYTAIRDIEVINLDGLPEAEALRLLGVDEQGKDLRGKTGAAEAWIDVLRDPSIVTLTKGAEFSPEGLRLPGGSGAFVDRVKSLRSDVALRVRTTFGGARLQLRSRSDGRGFYALTVVDDKSVAIQRSTLQQTKASRCAPSRCPALWSRDRIMKWNSAASARRSLPV